MGAGSGCLDARFAGLAPLVQRRSIVLAVASLGEPLDELHTTKFVDEINGPGRTVVPGIVLLHAVYIWAQAKYRWQLPQDLVIVGRYPGWIVRGIHRVGLQHEQRFPDYFWRGLPSFPFSSHRCDHSNEKDNRDNLNKFRPKL